MTMPYRLEIDGLRALAVVPVLLFHGGFQTFGGGFVGVDVFFVISGYLITSIILAELDASTFSIASFYERRARRILPALYLVLLASLLPAWLLLPNDLREFGQGLVAVVSFLSNVHLLRESGYFQAAAELNPLLHTWSLAVEEQYYLLFPALLLVCARFGRVRVALILTFIGACSLVLPELHDFGESHAKFFLLQTRAWELMLGSVLAVVLQNRAAQRLQSGRAAALASALGVGLIAFAVLTFDRHTPFPGPHALLPTVGTALVIACAGPTNFVGRVLASKPLVAVGLLSYSLYLWHQPLLAFARYESMRPLTVWQVLAILFVALLLSVFSWKYVERPFRNRRQFTRGSIFAMSIVGMVVFMIAGGWLHFTAGNAAAFTATLDPRQSAMWHSWQQSRVDEGCKFVVGALDSAFKRRFEACAAQHGRAIMFAGDSHAGDVHAAFVSNSIQPFVIGYSTPTLRPFKWPDAEPAQALIRFVEQHDHQVEAVFYATAGYHLLIDGSGNEIDREALRARSVPVLEPNPQAILRLTKYLDGLAKRIDVTWIGPRVEPHLNIVRVVKLALACDLRTPTLNVELNRGFLRLDEFLADASKQRKFHYFSSVRQVGFDPASDVFDCNSVYWSDGDHWSMAGEARFGKRLVESLPEPNSGDMRRSARD